MQYLVQRVGLVFLFFFDGFFEVLLNVHLSISILMRKSLFYSKFISCFYMFRAHVFIIRRSKLYYTASGITTLNQVSGLNLLKYHSINMSK